MVGSHWGSAQRRERGSWQFQLANHAGQRIVPPCVCSFASWSALVILTKTSGRGFIDQERHLQSRTSGMSRPFLSMYSRCSINFA
ncbi:hypothetical protein Poly30_54970 [Planctomycetes bacterium Poly30]|uniref:Uncharacterized protein n=1 Tax=Saltatorellus ferox TaxID=2528018 RepID=A0A518F0S0_9BACT|nr:hypothetical protein Poly30_54970 [Planctomycetes bacterium Poly30]